MSHGDCSSVRRCTSAEDNQFIMEQDTSETKLDEWSDIKDPNERRKIQNRLAQRRFREKIKEQKEESDREAENRRRACNAYASPEPGDIENNQTLSGLPWGGISMKHVIEKGKSKEQSSQQSSRENSVYGSGSRTEGSNRLGLRLTEKFARGSPAWRYFRYFPYRHPTPLPR